MLKTKKGISEMIMFISSMIIAVIIILIVSVIIKRLV